MFIEKTLKNCRFLWEDETRHLWIEDSEGEVVKLNKVYAFSLMRFLIRVAQRHWKYSKKKELPRPEGEPLGWEDWLKEDK